MHHPCQWDEPGDISTQNILIYILILIHQVIFDLVNTVMALIIISALITLAWYLRILVPWGCYGWISNTKSL